MSEFSNSMSQGSAPVAIILALALAATVGVSAQSWDAKGAARQAEPSRQGSAETRAVAVPADESSGAALVRVWVERATGDRSTNCASPAH